MAFLDLKTGWGNEKVLSMKNIAFIPARCGSKSIPFKNIKSFCGKPLIYWALSAASGAEEVDEVYVATDCEEIAREVENLNLPKVKVYFRDEENARDKSSTESVMLEFIEKKRLADNNRFILVQATNPLVRSSYFRDALDLYGKSGCDSLLSCARLKVFLWNSDGTPINYNYMNRPRRQDIEGELMENGSFYISTVGRIKDTGSRISGEIAIYEMPEYTAIDIDDDDDWKNAEMLMRKYMLI